MATETLETVIKKQQDIIEGLTNTSKGLFETSFNNLLTPFKKGSELWQEGLNAQKQLFEEGLQNKDAVEGLKKSPEYFQKWLGLQNEYTQKWLDLYQDASGVQAGLGKENLVKFSDSFKEAYTNWEAMMKDTYGKLNSDWKANLEKSAAEFPALASFMKSYETMAEHWKPILENGIIKGMLTKENFDKIFPEADFTKVVDSLMGLNSIENLKQATESFDKFYEAYFAKLQEVGQTTQKNIEGIAVQVEETYKGTAAEPLYKLYHDFSNSFADLKPAFGNFDVEGQTKKVSENFLKARKTYLDYLQTNFDFQQKVYGKAKEGMSETVEKFWEVYQKEGSTPSYDEFVASWLKISQEKISGILSSEELSAWKNELTSTRENVLKITDEMMAEYAKLANVAPAKTAKKKK